MYFQDSHIDANQKTVFHFLELYHDLETDDVIIIRPLFTMNVEAKWLKFSADYSWLIFVAMDTDLTVLLEIDV